MKCSRCGRPLKTPTVQSGGLALGPVCAAVMNISPAARKRQRKEPLYTVRSAQAVVDERQMALALEAAA